MRNAEDKAQMQMKKAHEEAMHDLTRMDLVNKCPPSLPPGEEPLGLLMLWERYIDEEKVEGGSALESLRARHWLGRHRA